MQPQDFIILIETYKGSHGYDPHSHHTKQQIAKSKVGGAKKIWILLKI
jgi:hypothetical protein